MCGAQYSRVNKTFTKPEATVCAPQFHKDAKRFNAKNIVTDCESQTWVIRLMFRKQCFYLTLFASKCLAFLWNCGAHTIVSANLLHTFIYCLLN